MSAQRSVLRKDWVSALASASLVLLSISPEPAFAGPDKCVLGQNLLYAECTGNQSTGVRENQPGVVSDFPTGTKRLIVRGLTRDIVTPFSGIKYRFDGNLTTTDGALEYDGGLRILDAAAMGIQMGKNGVAGRNGGNGSFFSPNGGNGGPGETWGSATISMMGTIRSVLSGINVSVTGGAGGAGGSNAGTCIGCTGTHGGAGGAGARVIVGGAGSVTTRGVGAPGTSIAQGIYIFAQGGNGANGRDATNLGGGGGNGGAGGAGTGGVSLFNQGDWSITTTAPGAFANAPGVRIEVVGGNGGSGGSADGGTGGRGAAGGHATGAKGVELGMAGQGGVWTISTRGDNSAAVHLSGKGGNGGSSTNQGAGTGFAGGDGGNGGLLAAAFNNGGRVEATTQGNSSPAIRLENQGGQGGRGGNAGFGGVGGAGGNGDALSLGWRDFTAKLSTEGDKSPGVLLYSKGGNGGRGGTGGGNGGNGGAGGAGGILGVTGGFDITTAGSESRGIQAFSFGGNSADGGAGVFGRPGGSDQQRGSREINVDVSGSVKTAGAKSPGIDAQSVAGHGGDSPVNIWSFAASAGSAGMGGNINLKSAATITTQGDQSSAISAASIGGGGGIGGPGFGLLYAVGGSGGIGGDGGILGIDNGGALSTSGNDAAGIYAKSIGGGGGSGGSAGSLLFAFGGRSQFGGNGGTVEVANQGAIQTGLPGRSGVAQDAICGKRGCSPGIDAQSVGGGGGDAGTEPREGDPRIPTFAPFSIGGAGGIGGNGGNVFVRNSGEIRTALQNSDAISAQSVGGGGGKGGGSVGVGVAALSVAVGGKGGAGGNGGAVQVCNGASGPSTFCQRNVQGGELKTTADYSRGITAQSVGGGGGDSNFAVSAAAGITVPAMAWSWGGSAGAAGKGGEVFVGSGSNIATGGRDSAGIHAQSTGGGGGSGGVAIAASGSNLGALSVAVGGSGGAAGDGGRVTVNTLDGTDIETQGASSSGIFAQSAGGGGGSAGVTVTAAAAQAGLNFSIGRSGGNGGNGGTVEVRKGTGTIRTRGSDSYGIAAQSVANSGGSGSLAVSAAAATIGTFNFAMGGSGGAGGVAGGVDVRNDANIRTQGRRSSGLFAQSVGGGGGDGGLSIAGSVLGTEANNASANVAIGGGAGNGGKGGNVTVENHGEIVVFSDSAMGIAAQSVGKGGGTGGLAISGRLANPGTDTYGLSFSLGGTGGGGGNAGDVIVKNTGKITTGGAIRGTPRNDGTPDCADPPCVKQYGISAQSVGGGGGTGGLAGNITAGAFSTRNFGHPAVNLNTSVGGFGGAAGLGGTVVVDNAGAITTHAAESSAIFAQSVSGGGGDGGQAVNFVVTPGQGDQIKAMSSSVTVGGFAGNGQVGGKVGVDNKGALVTDDYASHGIFAQSVGGGGGNGGDTGSFQFTISCVRGTPVTCKDAANSQGSWKLTAKIGGFGGTGNHGGEVAVSNEADITTRGAGSNAINAASIGGGGGTGGSDSGLTALPSQLPWVVGDRQTKFKELSIAVGGFGGAQGHGKDVQVIQDGHELHTEGAGSSGIYAQSVGGGGGTSRLFGSGGTVAAAATKPFAISVGGQGGAGGNGGNVTIDVKNGTKITTGGQPVFDNNGEKLKNSGSFGIFAQSVGGGGGFGGSSFFQGIPGAAQIWPDCDWCGKVSVGIGLPINGAGGAGGNGGAVNVKMNGSIETGTAENPGDSSPAIFAQSVGGGGGIAGFSAYNPFLAVVDILRGTYMGSANTGGSAGKVTVDFTGKITTWGAASHGIMAQSVGSGQRGSLTAQESNGGPVEIDFDGTLEALGEGSDGIWAQSNGFDKAGAIEIRIATDSVVKGGTVGEPFAGAGIELWDGANNSVINRGTVSSAEGVAVFHKGKGRVTVDNYGQLIGRVLLTGEGGGVVNNKADGIIFSDLVDLGAGGKLFNSGLIAPGGDGLVTTTRIRGDLIQDQTGRMLIDLDTVDHGILGARTDADLLSASGDVSLSGDIFVNTGELERQVGERAVTLVKADGFVTTSGLSIRSASGSDVVQYRLVQPTPEQLDLAYLVDFASPAVVASTKANQDSVARHLQRLSNADALDNGLANQLIDADATSYASALNSLSAEIVVDNQIASLQSSLRFTDDLHRCDDRDWESRSTTCTWSRIQGRQFERNATADNLGFETNSWEVASGFQSVSSEWRMGAAVAYEQSDLESPSPASSAGDQLHLGVSLGRTFGGAELSGSVTGGHASYDIEHWLGVGGETRTTSKQTMFSLEARVGAAYTAERDQAYIKPRLDLSLTRLTMSDFDETGDNAFRLDVADSEETYAALLPSLEIGVEFEPRSGMRLRPHATLGVIRFLGGAEPSVAAGFADHPDGVARFETKTKLDHTEYKLTAGVELLSDRGLIVQLGGFMISSDSGSGYGGGLDLRVPL